jgi:hypothetical protein
MLYFHSSIIRDAHVIELDAAVTGVPKNKKIVRGDQDLYVTLTPTRIKFLRRISRAVYSLYR